MTLRAVVVDDEPLAREGLADMLRMVPGVSVEGLYADGPAALAGIASLQPDVLFLDIRMPGMSGIELVEALPRERPPAIVFVTAYDAHAIKAFDLSAMDYLLKPVTAERLAQAVARVRDRGPLAADAMAALLDRLAPDRPRGVGRLIVREVGQITVVATADVDWIEGADYYARLHVGGKTHLLRETLASLEQRLDPGRFMRLSRSAIVNLARVVMVESELRGDGSVVLRSGTRVKVMAARRAELERRLEQLQEG